MKFQLLGGTWIEIHQQAPRLHCRVRRDHRDIVVGEGCDDQEHVHGVYRLDKEGTYRLIGPLS